MRWNKITENALRKPLKIDGSKVPRPFFVEDFAVSLTCGFTGSSMENPSGRPHWHISISMHSKPGHKQREWTPSHRKHAMSIINNALASVGQGEIYGAPSYDTVAMHRKKAMSGVEIDIARQFLK